MPAPVRAEGSFAAAAATMGSSSTTPVSKNSGSPISMAAPRLPQPAWRTPTTRRADCAIAPAAPENCNMAPSVRPSAITMPAPAMTSPNPC